MMRAHSTPRAARGWPAVFFLLLFSSISIFAQSGVDVTDFGAIPNDGIDDAGAFQSAVDSALSKKGGTIIVPVGKFTIKRGINVIPDGYIGADIKFAGQKGAVLEIAVGTASIAFYGGNLTSFVFEDLTFIGRNVDVSHPDFFDAKHVIFANYVQLLNVTRCNFFGLATKSNTGVNTGLIFVGNADAKISDSQFDGDASLYPTGAIIEAVDFRGLTISRCTFLDYANFGGQYFSKSTAFVGAWIRARNNTVFDDSEQRRVFIEDTRFDEGAASAVDVTGVSWVLMRGLNVNVNATSPGRGIKLTNVDYARIEHSSFRLATLPRPAVDVYRVKGLYVAGLRFFDQVYFLRSTGLGDLKVEFCPACTVTQPSRTRGTGTPF